MAEWDGKMSRLVLRLRTSEAGGFVCELLCKLFSTCSALNVCKRPSGSSPSPKMLPSGPVSSGSVETSREVAAKVRAHRTCVVHLCFFTKLPAA